MFDIPRHIVKPSRYTGNEPHAIRGRQGKSTVRFALCYPDLYDIGMSYYGFFLLYEVANSMEGVWCERCFAPWIDMEEHLRNSGQPLFTLESRTPLSRMDLVGFSLSYELNITNVLNMLDLSGIPIRADQRTDSHPLVLCGGPLTLNPRPFQAFFDLVVVGEGETIIREILDRMKAMKGSPREDIIRELSRLDGVYAPLLDAISPVKRLYIPDLDSSYHAVAPPIPVVGSVHNRLNVEISRGCGNGCRFCMAGYGYRPYRERSPDRIKEIVKEALARTGYEELSLLSLSAGDYSCLAELIGHIKGAYPGTSISLPSLKIGSISTEEIKMLGEGARGGFTFALEAASDTLRRRLNKDIAVDTLIRQLPLLRACGWRGLKLYLMVGFPWETEEDLRSVRQVIDPCLRSGIEVNLSVSPFTPKPHTPFERLAMEEEGELRSKIEIIKKSLPGKRVKVKVRDIKTSLVEALIARGDERLTPLFEYLHARGVRLEAWSEMFRIEPYRQWFEERELDVGEFLKARGGDVPLPWNFIDTGIDRGFLRDEAEKAEEGEFTATCLTGCGGCGLACLSSAREAGDRSASLSCASLSMPSSREGGDDYGTWTLRYTKSGDARYIGHLDTMSLLVRALKAAGMHLKMHGRYHPKPRMALSAALPVGVESTCEFLEIEAEPIRNPRETLERITRSLPDGMRAMSLVPLPMNSIHTGFLYILVTEGAGPDDGERWRERGGKSYYLWKGTKVKDLWVSGGFERIIKVDDRRIDGIRTRNQRDIQRNENSLS